ncbi:MAG: hypothetical protein PVI26_01755 [Chitinispirillia bacterium]
MINPRCVDPAKVLTTPSVHTQACHGLKNTWSRRSSTAQDRKGRHILPVY